MLVAAAAATAPQPPLPATAAEGAPINDIGGVDIVHAEPGPDVGGRESVSASDVGSDDDEEEGVEVEEGWALPCRHAYHHGCLLQWLRQCHSTGQTPRCPMCQAAIELEVGRSFVFWWGCMSFLDSQ